MENAVTKAEAREVSVMTDVQPSQVLEVISRAASDPNIDIDKFERLMQMHERMAKKQAEAAYNAAMSAAQAEIGRVSADKTNTHTRSVYASYAALDRVLRPIYTKHGFALSFDEGDSPKDEHTRVLCYVSHRGGFSKTHHKDMPTDGKGAKGGEVMTKTHAAGSAMQYGMRYLLKGIFNVAIGDDPDDDDGNAAGGATITEAQVADLNALMLEVHADFKRFLKHFKIQHLEELPAAKYKDAVAALEKKRK